MKTTLNKLAFLFLLFFAAANMPSYAQGTGGGSSCDTCTATWGPEVTTSFTFSIPSRPWCIYRAYVVYRSRLCGALTQFEIVSAVIEDLNPPGSTCFVSCIDAPAIHQVIDNHVMNLLGTVGVTFYRALPSPCYYTGTIVVPPGAETCFGMTPGTTRHVLMPCDTNGCCFSELTVVSPGHFFQNVISSTPCPAAPVVPPSATIAWSCDILGGGMATFTVRFTPDTPLTCFMYCSSGFYKKATGTPDIGVGEIAGLNVYPNPASDIVHVTFDASAGKTFTATLYDISGKLVAEQQLVSTSGKQDITLNVQHLPAGQYLCKLRSSTEEITVRVTKQ